MGMAFEISQDDISTIVEQRLHCRAPVDGPLVEAIFDLVDADAAEEAALRADDLDDQTTAAYDEIERQMRGNPEIMALINAAPPLQG